MKSPESVLLPSDINSFEPKSDKIHLPDTHERLQQEAWNKNEPITLHFPKKFEGLKAETIVPYEGKMEIPESVKQVCREIKERGGRALLVGGCVRDMLMNNELEGFNLKPKDFDIEVYGIEPKELQDMLEQAYGDMGTVSAVGKAFGVIKIPMEDLKEPLDVAVPRRDSKTGDGHNDVEVETDPHMAIDEAAKRRDLTINSISYDPLSETLFDPYGGLEDLRNKTIEVTDKLAFQEDPLRVMRVMQFAARFEGFEVGETTKKLCKEMIEAGDLDKLPFERVSGEFKKLLVKGKKPSVGLNLARELGFVERYWPELDSLIDVQQEEKWHPEGDVWTHTLQVIDAAARIADREGLNGGETEEDQASNEEKKLILMLAALCHDLGKASTTKLHEDGQWHAHGHEAAGVDPTREFLKRFDYSNKLKDKVVALVPEHMGPMQWYINEQKTGDSSDKALRRLGLRLAEKGIDTTMLAYVMEADQRGRNGDGSEPLELDSLEEFNKFRDWFLDKIETLNLNVELLKKVVNGGDIIKMLKAQNPQFKVDVWVDLLTELVYQDQTDEKILDKEQLLWRVDAYHRFLSSYIQEEIKKDLDLTPENPNYAKHYKDAWYAHKHNPEVVRELIKDLGQASDAALEAERKQRDLEGKESAA